MGSKQRLLLTIGADHFKGGRLNESSSKVAVHVALTTFAADDLAKVCEVPKMSNAAQCSNYNFRELAYGPFM